MDSPKYACLLEQLCLAADTHDWIMFDSLILSTRKAHDHYNTDRLRRGWQPVRIYEESWVILNRHAHELVWN